jgi:hypothetical protein
VADAFKAGRLVEVIDLIRKDTGTGLIEAKGTYQHFVREAGKCHWCGEPIASVITQNRPYMITSKPAI